MFPANSHNSKTSWLESEISKCSLLNIVLVLESRNIILSICHQMGNNKIRLGEMRKTTSNYTYIELDGEIKCEHDIHYNHSSFFNF